MPSGGLIYVNADRDYGWDTPSGGLIYLNAKGEISQAMPSGRLIYLNTDGDSGQAASSGRLIVGCKSTVLSHHVCGYSDSLPLRTFSSQSKVETITGVVWDQQKTSSWRRRTIIRITKACSTEVSRVKMVQVHLPNVPDTNVK